MDDSKLEVIIKIKEELLNLFNTPGKIGKKYKFKDIRNHICGRLGYKIEDVRDALSELELEGKIYYSDFKQLYMAFTPELNRVQGNIHINKHGEGFIEKGKYKYKILTKDLNGALDGDLVVVTIKDKKDHGYYIAKMDKIIKRKDGMVVVEVKSKCGELYLEPFNAYLDAPIVINNIAMKPLVEGDRIQVKIDKKEKGFYAAGYIGYVGHKDDPDADIKMIALANGIQIEFSKEALEEADNIPTEVLKEEKIGRLDLTNKLIFTIDGAETKDRDDAISLEKKENGNYLLGVHIADVSHYVKPGMQLWDEAKCHGTSAYLLNTVIPMLPHKLSNGICSLNPNVERLAFSCVMEINQNGQVVSYDFVDTYIKSQIAMTYEAVNELLEEDIVTDEYEPFVENLELMKELSDILERAKIKRGYVNFGSNDLKIKTDDDGQVKEIKQRLPRTAEKIIENFMLLAGECAANYSSPIPTPYRVHREPEEDKVEEAFELIQRSGIRVRSTHEIVNGRVIQQILEQIKNADERSVAANIMLRAMNRAGYSPVNCGHFGLGLAVYGQFTSPIRRAPDLVMHHNIRMIRDNTFKYDLYDQEYEKMDSFCKHASRKEMNADQAEKEANQFIMLKYMDEHIGEKFVARVTYVNSKGIFIKTAEGIEGKINPCDLEGDDFFYDDRTCSFKGKRSKIKIGIGSGIIVTAIDTKREYRTINFALDEDEFMILKKQKRG
ncbi:MAG: VacB/RNase II family 3'-5' exoribonuclease [Bacilli bacterium]|nr:VacB/RNase II family 3'-5' exoribonuclease [Bacilli bacterium]